MCLFPVVGVPVLLQCKQQISSTGHSISCKWPLYHTAGWVFRLHLVGFCLDHAHHWVYVVHYILKGASWHVVRGMTLTPVPVSSFHLISGIPMLLVGHISTLINVWCFLNLWTLWTSRNFLAVYLVVLFSYTSGESKQFMFPSLFIVVS